MADNDTPESPPKKKVELTNGSLLILDSFLAAPGWAKSPKTIYTAGKLVSNLDFMIQRSNQPDRPILESDTAVDVARKVAEKYNDEHKDWAEGELGWELTKVEREVITESCNHHIEAGNIAPSPHLCRIIEQFELIEE